MAERTWLITERRNTPAVAEYSGMEVWFRPEILRVTSLKGPGCTSIGLLRQLPVADASRFELTPLCLTCGEEQIKFF
jgi:hypothetical protein